MTSRNATALAVGQEITQLIRSLVLVGLVDDQNFPAARSRAGGITVVEADYWAGATHGMHRRGTRYQDYHDTLKATRCYDLRMLDGALVQLRYEFKGANLIRSSMGFFPPPDLTPYQEDPDLYLLDELYGHVADVRVVTVPLRLEFDARASVAKALLHPAAHATIGQYPYCRLPMSSPATPHQFIEFILRCFYRSSDQLWNGHLPTPKVSGFPECIHPDEAALVHLAVP